MAGYEVASLAARGQGEGVRRMALPSCGGSASPAMNKSDDAASKWETAAGDEPADDELVARAQRGDTRAYDALVTRHRGRLYAMIRQMVKNEADAWDLSQESFIKAWNALPRFEAKARFSTWLYRIAHNTVYDWARRRRPEVEEEIITEARIDPASTTTPATERRPDEALEGNELRQKIEAALDRLPPDQRQAVVLKDVQGLAYKEIAEVMDCSIGTVMSRLFYARKKLQEMLKDEAR